MFDCSELVIDSTLKQFLPFRAGGSSLTPETLSSQYLDQIRLLPAGERLKRKGRGPSIFPRVLCVVPGAPRDGALSVAGSEHGERCHHIC